MVELLQLFGHFAVKIDLLNQKHLKNKQLEIKHFQFEREGYFTIDAVESRGRSLVFNRTITLRDSLRKQVS